MNLLACIQAAFAAAALAVSQGLSPPQVQSAEPSLLQDGKRIFLSLTLDAPEKADAEDSRGSLSALAPSRLRTGRKTIGL